MQIILASTSPYRKSLLEKLNISFSCIAPMTDETPQANEKADDLARRLAIAKAHAININDNAYIIGSDQVATVDGLILGKPGSIERAISQLEVCSGKTVSFYTGLCLKEAKTNTVRHCVDQFDVTFKKLSSNQIETYVNTEKPLNCAGSFKSEGLGILLFEELQGRDPNALVGLPLIALNELFQAFGIDLLTQSQQFNLKS
ncbi:septum formation inhibitor Maf [Alteromonadaceae bacterium M269]|nr:septum formation inhibitor Maf [Alteromonadaceae bacterium M269]